MARSRVRKKAGFTLAREVLVSGRDIDIDVMYHSKRFGTFDLVLFSASLSLSTLSSPSRVASVAGSSHLETVEIWSGSAAGDAFYPDRELNGDPTNWWGPNAPAVRGMLESLGFERVTTVTRLPNAAYRAARAAYHHLRGKNSLALAFRQDRAVFHAHKPAT